MKSIARDDDADRGRVARWPSNSLTKATASSAVWSNTSKARVLELVDYDEDVIVLRI
jgi:hypothetical protein